VIGPALGPLPDNTEYSNVTKIYDPAGFGNSVPASESCKVKTQLVLNVFYLYKYLNIDSITTNFKRDGIPLSAHFIVYFMFCVGLKMALCWPKHVALM
jgi:hypothetical protein